jgi:predicted dienelactone hydrolase
MKKILLLLLISAFPFYSARASESVLEPGPYQAGHQTWMLEDFSRGVPSAKNSMGSDTRKLTTEIWYPSDDVSWTISGRNAPLTASPGPFPLIVYSHGILSERMETEYLARYLATQGVVFMSFTAPATSLYNAANLNYGDIVNIPGDVSFLIDEILKRNADPSSPFYAKIDETCIGAAGTSLGAGVSLMAGFKSGLRDPRLSLVVTFAAGAREDPAKNIFDSPDISIPLLLIHGDIDAIIPYDDNAPVLFSAAPGPAYLLTLVGGTHTGFAHVSTLFFWTDNVDNIGCAALSMAGLDLCDLPLPAGMDPQRQHDLTAMATWNFIAMHFSRDLKKRAQAAEFLLSTMPEKYHEDIAIQSNGKSIKEME